MQGKSNQIPRSPVSTVIGRITLTSLTLSIIVWFISCVPKVASASTPAVYPSPTASPLGNATCASMTGVTNLTSIVFESSVAQPSGFNLAIYAASSCLVSNEIYQTGQVGAGAVIVLNIPFSTSTTLYYTMSGLTGDGFRITYNP